MISGNTVMTSDIHCAPTSGNTAYIDLEYLVCSDTVISWSHNCFKVINGRALNYYKKHST